MSAAPSHDRPQAVTANRLTDGAVVYLDSKGDWSRRIGSARVADDAETLAAMLRAAAEAEAARAVVGAYAIDVSVDGDAVKPVKYKEVIRAFGPSSHAHFGLQASEDPTTAYMNGV
jgi:hypothetical protein